MLKLLKLRGYKLLGLRGIVIAYILAVWVSKISINKEKAKSVLNHKERPFPMGKEEPLDQRTENNCLSG